MSSVRVDSGRQRIGFFMLGAAAIALLLRKRDSHDAPAESETSS
jgi:hypothetical protein